jgi:signal transduction histidine kinase
MDNLLLNAVKYSPDGGRITMRVSANDHTARIRVSDHGVGIAQKLQKKLFTRFYRADEAGVASGLGLGLYISRMLIEAHGGTIDVESRPGTGSVFTVSLPRETKHG